MKRAFIPEDHFESKVKNKLLWSQGTVLSFTPQPFTPKTRPVEKGRKRILRDNMKYEEFQEINQMHREYMKKIIGNLHPDAALEIIYKADLTGAQIEINNHKGYVVHERKNSLAVIFPTDEVKIFPKSIWDFKISFEGIDYIFFGKNLKKNRFMRK